MLCIAETPYQATMAFLLFRQRETTGAQHVTLALSNAIPNAKAIAYQLTRTKAFDRVTILEPSYSLPVRFYGAFNIFQNFFFRSYCKRQYQSFSSSVLMKSYDVLACSGTTRLTLDARLYSTANGISIFFDDGAGSHTGSIFQAFSFFDDIGLKTKDMVGIRHRAKSLAKAIARRVFPQAKYNTKEIWLFDPSSQEVDNFSNIAVKTIPSVDRSELTKIFSGENQQLRLSTEAVYLSLPSSVHQELRECERKIIDLLETIFGRALSVKVHPRCSDNAFTLTNAKLIPSSVNWEKLILNGAINEKTLLFGLASTAQLTPKTFMDLEPNLFLLYNLFPKNLINQESCRRFAEEARRKYSDPSRVHTVESWDNLRALATQLRPTANEPQSLSACSQDSSASISS